MSVKSTYARHIIVINSNELTINDFASLIRKAANESQIKLILGCAEDCYEDADMPGSEEDWKSFAKECAQRLSRIKMKGKTRKAIEDAYYEGESLTEREQEQLEGFLLSYDQDVLNALNKPQIFMLYHMFWQQTQDTDYLSHSLCMRRRSVINTANALVRRGLLCWECPTGSNLDRGYDLCLVKKSMLTEKYLSLG